MSISYNKNKFGTKEEKKLVKWHIMNDSIVFIKTVVSEK